MLRGVSSFFIQNQLGILPVFLIGGNQDKIHVGGNAETPVSAEFTFQLGAQIGCAILQKLYGFSIGKPVLQIDIASHKGIEGLDLGHPLDAQSVDLIHQLLFEGSKLLRSGQMTEEEYNQKKAKAGYYFAVRGKSWGRSVEAVNFFVAIREAGYPVMLEDAEGILARFEGTDLIGIVPGNCPTRYCEDRFPAKYGTILDFMHVDDEDMENFGEQIEWLPETPAALIEK